jgi:hypothetical protein
MIISWELIESMGSVAEHEPRAAGIRAKIANMLASERSRSTNNFFCPSLFLSRTPYEMRQTRRIPPSDMDECQSDCFSTLDGPVQW